MSTTKATQTSPGQRSRRARRRKPAHSTIPPQMRAEVGRIVHNAIKREPEVKYLTTGLNTTFGGVTTMTFLSLTDVPQAAGASTDTTRIGDFITARSLQLRLNIIRNPATSNVVEFVRIMVIQRHAQFSVDPPTFANTFLNDPVSVATNFRSFYIQDGRHLYTVLLDRMFTMTGLTATTEGAIFEHINVSLASARKKLNYISGSTTNGIDNIFVGYLCNTVTTPPTLTFGAKFEFTDV